MEKEPKEMKKRKREKTEHELASLFYFAKVLGTENEYKCKVCPNVIRTLKAGKGYTNLWTHVSDHHKDYKNEMAISAMNNNNNNNTLNNFLLPLKEKNIYDWLDWIIGEGLPFITVEKPLTRKYSKLDPISVDTFMKYMNKCTMQVEDYIKSSLPEKFSILFDGWTLEGQSTQFIGIFASFINDRTQENEKVLVAFQPLMDESDYSAESLNFIPPGTVIVESLFSIVGYMFDDRRMATTPTHIEEQVFLKVNRNLWNEKSFFQFLEKR